jgi:hypothetical protein
VVTRGKVHNYLGMTIAFSEDGKVKMEMEDDIQEMLDKLPNDMGGKRLHQRQTIFLRSTTSRYYWMRKLSIWSSTTQQNYCSCPRELDPIFRRLWPFF